TSNSRSAIPSLQPLLPLDLGLDRLDVGPGNGRTSQPARRQVASGGAARAEDETDQAFEAGDAGPVDQLERPEGPLTRLPLQPTADQEALLAPELLVMLMAEQAGWSRLAAPAGPWIEPDSTRRRVERRQTANAKGVAVGIYTGQYGAPKERQQARQLRPHRTAPAATARPRIGQLATS